jgi:hypothetical protein
MMDAREHYRGCLLGLRSSGSQVCEDKEVIFDEDQNAWEQRPEGFRPRSP